MNIYVGNLPYQVTDDELRQVFEQFGAVSSARVIMDRETQRSKGFGFVEMDKDDDANAAIQSLNGSDYNGRPLRVNEARPREDRPRGGGGGGGGWGRG
jgi:RNA recognition motif-containing protein